MGKNNQSRTENYRGFTITCETPEQRAAYRQFVDEHYVTLACLRRESEPEFRNSFLKVIVPVPSDEESIAHHNAQRSARCTDQSGCTGSLSLASRTACSMSSVVFMQSVMRNQPPYRPNF